MSMGGGLGAAAGLAVPAICPGAAAAVLIVAGVARGLGAALARPGQRVAHLAVVWVDDVHSHPVHPGP